jgi:hypothetical protein
LSLFGYGRLMRVSLKYLLIKFFSFNIYHMILFFLFHPYHIGYSNGPMGAVRKKQVKVFLHLFFVLRLSASATQVIPLGG